jgi:hypothetical protein
MRLKHSLYFASRSGGQLALDLVEAAFVGDGDAFQPLQLVADVFEAAGDGGLHASGTVFLAGDGVYHLRGAGFVLFGDDGDAADAFVGFALDVAHHSHALREGFQAFVDGHRFLRYNVRGCAVQPVHGLASGAHMSAKFRFAQRCPDTRHDPRIANAPINICYTVPVLHFQNL